MTNQAQKLLNIDPELIIGTREAAEILKVSDREIRSKIKRGTLPAAKYGGRYLLNRKAVVFYQRLHDIMKNKDFATSSRSKNMAIVNKNLIFCNSFHSSFDLSEINDWPPVYPNVLIKI
jgi:excisionase family DNA binding protein